MAFGPVYFAHLQIIPRPSNFPITGCLVNPTSLGDPTITLAAWVPTLFAQCVYFVLTMARFIRLLQNLDVDGNVNVRGLLQMRRLVPTMVLFVRDGAYYFFLAMLTILVNTILLFKAPGPGPLKNVALPWMMALCPLLATHMYLNMQDFLHENANTATSMFLSRNIPEFTASHGEDTELSDLFSYPNQGV
ncbi:hypothetical protein BDQ12DRAFT_737319 [Crucibulum laeve]|uniref:Uncharacterized protein n=1 Tax=Crucibulum laeve TaxID=68775 RepID=A0A5C3LV58_9AGAR|nr:hypothetical protein BDQ12DRAFT_737319 [Crucibulum laeve]